MASIHPVRTPSFRVDAPATYTCVVFAALPTGHEFTVVVLSPAGGRGLTRRSSTPDLFERIRALEGDFHFETLHVSDCQNCPDVVQAAQRDVRFLNPRIRHIAIAGALYRRGPKIWGSCRCPPPST